MSGQDATSPLAKRGRGFRQPFRGVNVREDIASIPWLVTRTPAVWLPSTITILSAAAFTITAGSDFATRFLFAYFVQTPALGSVVLAGVLAPRASWIAGSIVGLVSAIAYSAVIAYVALGTTDAALARDAMLSSVVLSPLVGMLFAAFGAWSRRLVVALIELPRPASDEPGTLELGEPPPTAIVRIYVGRQQADAVPAFQADATALAQSGYEPTSQSWAQGQWGCGSFLVALVLLLVFFFGILAFVYMLLVKPDGTLTVTYARSASSPSVAAEPADDTKVCPRCAEEVKAAALVCRYCGHEFAGSSVTEAE